MTVADALTVLAGPLFRFLDGLYRGAVSLIFLLFLVNRLIAEGSSCEPVACFAQAARSAGVDVVGAASAVEVYLNAQVYTYVAEHASAVFLLTLLLGVLTAWNDVRFHDGRSLSTVLLIWLLIAELRGGGQWWWLIGAVGVLPAIWLINAVAMHYFRRHQYRENVQLDHVTQQWLMGWLVAVTAAPFVLLVFLFGRQRHQRASAQRSPDERAS